MLTTRIDPADLGQPWRWTGAQWQAGWSWITPYRHPATEQTAVTDGTRTLLITRERRLGRPPTSPVPTPGTPADLDAVLTDLETWPGDWTAIHTSPGQPVRITAGPGGIAPLYLTAHRGSLHGSWDLTELRGRFDGSALNLAEVARRVAMSARYCSATPWRDVHLLTERASAEYTPDGKLALHYPAPAAHSHARELHPGADVLSAFDTVLGQAVAARMWAPAATGVQLSGGMDSSNVALSLARLAGGRPVVATAVMLPGPAGQQQAERRNLMLRAFGGWPDVTVEALAHLPLHPESDRMRARPVPPHADLYAEAMNASTAALAEAGAAVAFTGIGGDELVLTSRDEEPRAPGNGLDPYPWLGPVARAAADDDTDTDTDTGIAPTTIAPESALQALTVCGPGMLRHGLWPAHPMTDRSVVTFCEWLPIEWRARKRLLRERLAAAGLPQQVAYPTLPETFSPVALTAMRRYGPAALRRILRDGSPLIAAGVVDPDALAAVAERLESGRHTDQDREAIFVITMDAALRAFA